MKKILVTLLALLVCGAAWAAQDTDITPTELRNPKTLEVWLEANALDAESRLTSNATNSEQLILTTLNDAGTARITMQADAPSGVADDAGDKFAIIATDGSGLAIQSDAAVKGTLATKVTISGAGGISAADAITLTDANGAATISAIGYEASAAVLILDADIGTDANDTVTLSAADGGVLSILNAATEILTLSPAGALAVDAGIAAGDAITLTDADGAAVISAIGAEASAAQLVLDADLGTDNNDTVTISAADGGVLSINNHTTEILTLSTAGALAVDAGITAGDAIALTDADGAAEVTIKGATGDYDASIFLISDNDEDATDDWEIEADGAAGNALTFKNNTTARLTITAAGAVSLGGVLDVGSITTDAASGIDVQAAGAFKVGVTTATSIDIGSATVTDVQVVTDGGTLDVGTTANTLTLTAGTTDSAVFAGADAAGAANTVYDTTGAGAITVGSADVTGLTLTSSDGSFDIGATASTFTFKGVGTGNSTATLIADDSDGTAASLLIDVTGAGAITIGSADVTAITLTGADGSLALGATDGTVTFSTLSASTATTITCADSDANADMTVVPGGTGDLTLGDVTDSSVRIPIQMTATLYAASLVVDSTYYGKLILCTTNGAVAVTLPANNAPAGSWFEFAIVGTDDCAPVISSTPADTLITPNSVDSDSVTWGTTHRIGAKAKFWADGANWHVDNLGGTTMTYTDSD